MFFGEAGDETPLAVTPVMKLMVGANALVVLAIALYAEPFIRLANRSVQILAASF
jgi:hypothetical protein